MSTAQNEKLRISVVFSRVEGVLQAIERGANVNYVHEKYTPIFLASDRNRIEMVQLLITYGADVNLGTDFGSTPLHRASERGYAGIARLLVENGADVDASDANNKTPLYSAVIHEKLDIVRLLVENGADVNVADVQQMTPMHIASAKGSVEVVRLLIENGADLNAKSSSNQTPWNLACSKGQANKLSEVFRAGRQLNPSAPDLQTINETETSLSSQLRSLHTSSPSTTPECSICTENEANHGIIPCGHVFCLECINRIQRESHNCPTCRCRVRNSLRLYFN